MTLTIHPKMQQRSPEWYAARRGMVTASIVDKLVTVAAPDATAVACPKCETIAGTACVSLSSKARAEIKSFHDERTQAAANLPPTYVAATGDTARGLVMALAAERIAQHTEDTFVSSDMWRGIEAEPYARDVYAEHCTNEPVDECGFMVREFDGFSIGYSPDGLVGDDGLIEIKAPRQKGHLTNVTSGEVPGYYMAQLQTALLVSGRKWIDFVSYNGGMHLWPKRVTADPAWQAGILAAAQKAESDIAEIVAKYEAATVGLPLTKRIDFFNDDIQIGA